jgi:hypothetical protein
MAPVSEVLMHYKVYRLEDDGSTTLISEHGDVVSGIAAGKQIVEHEDFDCPYALHSNGRRLATFAEGRIGCREWARRCGRLDYINSPDDRYDHAM